MSATSDRRNSPRWFTHAPRLVDTVTSGEVVTMRSARLPPALAISSRIRPNAAWVDCSSPEGGGDRGDFDLAERAIRASRGRCGCARAAPRTPGRALSPMLSSGSHSRPFGNAHRFAPGGHLRRVHQARVIVLVAGEGQSLSLDRPGDEQGGNVVLRRVERFDERLHAMAAKVGEQGGEGCVVIGLEERRRGFAYLFLDARTPCRAALIVERGKLGVAAASRTSS